jgi:ferric-dicitrate binding protein FerR (iron transport regulator)
MHDLFNKFIENKCSPEEVKQLLDEFKLAENEESLRLFIRKQLETDPGGTGFNSAKYQYQADELYVKISQKLKDGKSRPRYRIISIFGNPWLRVAAVAFVFVFIGTLGYYLLNENTKKEVIATNKSVIYGTDLLPGGNKAILTLSDNSSIILDTARNGVIREQGGTRIIKLADGQLSYNAAKGRPKATEYNTISTPRGGEYKLTLPDGSMAYLNAASSIKFPVAFTGRERKVEITGEVYFEVAKDVKSPFRVKVGDMTVEALGTEFNVMSYSEESSVQATLIGGVIRVSQHENQVTLSPGQQARLEHSGELTVADQVDIDEIVAWRKGLFIFNHAHVEEIMQQIGRWYDVEIEFAGEISHETFTGVISRKSNVSRVLNIMQKAGLKFTVTEEKIKVEKYSGE